MRPERELIETPMRDDAIDLGAILNAINEHTRIVFIANPNNPTGTMLDASSVDRFVAEVPGHVVVVLDEAYYEYATHFAARRQVEYSRSLNYIAQGCECRRVANILEGPRPGGTCASATVWDRRNCCHTARRCEIRFRCRRWRRRRRWRLLTIRSMSNASVSNNASQAQVIGVALSEMGFRVVPTSANFLYCDLAEDAGAIAERLRVEGISVRPLRRLGSTDLHPCQHRYAAAESGVSEHADPTPDLASDCCIGNAVQASPLTISDASAGSLAAPYRPASLPSNACVMIVFFLVYGAICAEAPSFLCNGIFRSARGVDQRPLSQFCEHLRSERIPCADHAATDHEHFEIENVDEVGKQNSQCLAEAFKDSLGIEHCPGSRDCRSTWR